MVTVTSVKVATCTVVVDTTTVDVVLVTVDVEVRVGISRQLHAFDTLVQANCLKPGGALLHASGATGLGESGFAVLDGALTGELVELVGFDVQLVELSLTGLPRLTGAGAAQEPDTVALHFVSYHEIDRRAVTYTASTVEVTVSAVNVVVPVMVLSMAVRTEVVVIVSKTCVVDTEVEVLVVVVVTVAAGTRSKEEQNEVAVDAPLRAFTTAETIWHSYCLRAFKSRGSSTAGEATANERRNGTMYVRIL
jgi:hypothetical protein